MIREMQTTLIKTIQRTHNVKSFRFENPDNIPYRPGQFFQLFLVGNGEEIDHYFSFSSSPTEKGYLEFTKKMSESDYSKTLNRLRPGDPVRMKLPMGQFIYEGDPPQAAFLSGGIGVTPIRSICKYLTDTGSSASVRVLYCARTVGDLVFVDDFDEMEENNPSLSLTYLVTDQKPPAGWKGRTGKINADIIRKEIPDYRERPFYICGPPGMVKAMAGMLTDNLDLPADQVITENFGGY